MHCIFCKKESSASRSSEHIVPESLGNLSHILSPGVVCDSCNNYFSREVEKPFLESTVIRELRFNQALPSKRGKVPAVGGIITPGFPVTVHREFKPELLTTVELEPRAFEHIVNSKKGVLYLPMGTSNPDGFITSRFLAKIAVEAMAARLADHPEGLEYIVNEDQLDLIRDHARRGYNKDWPFNARRIYEQDKQWPTEGGESSQIVHEFDILCTNWSEWFFVLAIFGLELVINYGGPEIEGYQRWLKENDNASPLYWGKNKSG